MQKQIASYLFQQKTCPLPGLGSLSVASSAAVSDFTNKLFTAPEPMISFRQEAVNSEDLQDYLAVSSGMDKTEAAEALTRFCTDIKDRVLTGQEVHLQNIGSFFVNASGILEFKQESLPAAFTQSVFAERVIHPDAEHQILVGDRETTNTVMTELLAPGPELKDRWWIWAIVLGVVALIALLIYFTALNGNSLFGNTIKI